MAFMAHGHMAGEGKYGKQLERATEYVIDCQKANGLVTRRRTGRPGNSQGR